MAIRISRNTRRTLRNLNHGAQDIKGYIEENPVTSALLALATGVLTTSAVKMAMTNTPIKTKARTEKLAAKTEKQERRAGRKKAGKKARANKAR